MNAADFRIQTKTFFLRPIKITDAEFLCETSQHPDILHYMEDDFGTSTLEVANAYIKQKTTYPPSHFICESANRKIAYLGIDPAPIFPSKIGISVGYIIPEFQNKGIGLKGFHLIVWYAFQVLGYQKLVSFNFPYNTRMKKVLEFIGYKFVGQNEMGVKNKQPAIQDVYVAFPSMVRPPENFSIFEGPSLDRVDETG